METCGSVDVILNTFLMSLAILFHFLCAQHVSDINISSEFSASSPGHYIPEERAPTATVETVMRRRSSAPVGSKFSNMRFSSSFPSHSVPTERNLLAPY